MIPLDNSATLEGEKIMKYLMFAAVSLAFAAPAVAEGDVAAGEKDFKKCMACHMIANGDEVIAKGGKTGPNLYGVVGRPAASVEDFKYGASIIEAAEDGLVWDEDNLVTYLENPKAFLTEVTGDSGAKSKMTFRLKEGQDVVAYLASVSPDSGEMEEDQDDSEEESEDSDSETESTN